MSSSSRKRGSRPTANGCALSSRLQKPWIVEIQAPSRSRASSASPRSTSADPPAQLSGCLPRVRDDEDRVDVEPVPADGAHVLLDEDRRLARAGARRDEHVPGRLDGGEFVAEPNRLLDDGHVRATFTLSTPGTSARGRTTTGTGRPSAGRGGRRPRGCAPRSFARDRGRTPPVPRTRPRRGSRLARTRQLVAGGLPQHPARDALARQRLVDAAERLEADEFRRRGRRAGSGGMSRSMSRAEWAPCRLVVLHDAAGAPGVDVDPVDLAPSQRPSPSSGHAATPVPRGPSRTRPRAGRGRTGPRTRPRRGGTPRGRRSATGAGSGGLRSVRSASRPTRARRRRGSAARARARPRGSRCRAPRRAPWAAS